MTKQIKINYTNITYNKDVREYLSKIQHYNRAISKLRPFEDPDILSQVKSFYKIDCVWSSEALEGNSITKGETQVMLEEGVTVEGHPLKDILRTAGHAEAFDEMFELINNKRVSVKDILHLHSLIMGKENSKIAGTYKTKQNLITGSGYTTIPPRQIPAEMEKLDTWLQDRYDKENPVMLAAELHRKLVYIHPFLDGNGRTARLAMNTVLIQNGYLPISISPYMKRDYISALELGRQGDLDAFYYFIAEAEYETESDFCRYMDINIKPMPRRAKSDGLTPIENTIESIDFGKNDKDAGD